MDIASMHRLLGDAISAPPTDDDGAGGTGRDADDVESVSEAVS
jgi:hypothetical protein